MSAFRKGSCLPHSAQIKKVSAVLCAVLPLALTAYSGLARNHDLAISVEDMGLFVTFMIGAIGAASTVLTSPKVGLPALDTTRRLR